MDTNENQGAVPSQGAFQEQPKGNPGQQKVHAPQMDGVSAGGRPQRPVPRKTPERKIPAGENGAGNVPNRARPQTAQRENAPEKAAESEQPKSAAPAPERSAPQRREPAQSPQRSARPAAPSGNRPENQTQRKQAAPGEEKTAPRRPQDQSARRPARPAQPGESRPRKPAEAGARRPRAADGGKTPQPRRRPAPAEKPRKKKADTAGRSRGDSGYQPYRRANERRKAQRSSNLRAFFSDQNPVLKWYERVRYNKDSFAEESDLAKQRQARRAQEEEKRHRRQSRFNAPAVIYTQPAAFNRDRLAVQLISVLTVVVALMVGLSIFFKVGRITVSGAEVYQPWSIVEASGISKGENLLTLSRARATSQILANLPYVKKVRIGIKLPDTVNIEIEEGNVAYAIKDDQGTWWLMDSDAKVTEMINSNAAANYTQILGLTLSSPKIGEIGVPTEALQAEPGETQEGEETLPTVAPIVVSGAEKMAVAQQILKALEDNDIVGGAASVDVTNIDDVILWYGSRYQVMLGDSSDPNHSISYKIACMYDAILQMSDYQTGILDVSFTSWESQVALTPFE